MSHSMWIATLGGWIERVLLSMDGDNDSVIQYVYDNLDPVIKAQGLDIDIGELGNIKTSDFRKLLCDSRRNL